MFSRFGYTVTGVHNSVLVRYYCKGIRLDTDSVEGSLGLKTVCISPPLSRNIVVGGCIVTPCSSPGTYFRV